ncbi:rhodanese-like domain-containing protein [Sulfurovum sp. zt1-1]|uniref:Rhodanese-like domain-containing protein n=1 Tax=Sulfurovum zhangzhouensis TaxID=3019067 RepID=A0ABT7QYS7_9BACT|nr:rhodanese-like domain-containing protein [Sulfurovum zhangzhouensis]MDM5271921.1 rhodanese-like domain-containing protein [Sulfurovum zhangzhouensis]
MKKLLCLIIISVALCNCDADDLILDGVKTKYTDENGKEATIIVKRQLDTSCQKLPITNETFWENGYANDNVPNACKSTFITSAGKTLFPMMLHPKIETVAEPEVLDFIQFMQKDPTMLLIDTRGEEWYNYRTIPGAINIHYLYIMEAENFPAEYKEALAILGIKSVNHRLDFSEAKDLLLFCNGAWCSQSPKMIRALLKMGYPPEKMKWYRGGLEDWLGFNMTTTKTKNSL